MPGRHDQSTRSAFETPAKTTRMKAKSPAHREWKSMRQRVLSLTQQVAALKSAKESLTKSLNEQISSNEKLQNDLNQSQQRAKISKQTVEVTRRNSEFRNFTHTNRLDLVAQLAEHWTSKPKVAGSIPTEVRQIFQLARCEYTLRVTPQTHSTTPNNTITKSAVFYLFNYSA